MADSSLEIKPRRKPGRKPKIQQLTPDATFAIRYTYLTDPHATMGKIGQQFGLSIAVIAQLLTGPEYEAIRDQIHRLGTAAVRDKLQAASELAADSWIKTFPAAMAKGDHRPMKDLLTANKVIDPTGQGNITPVVIQIGVQGTVTIAPQPIPVSQSPANTPALTPASPPDIEVQVQGTSTQPVQDPTDE